MQMAVGMRIANGNANLPESAEVADHFLIRVESRQTLPHFKIIEIGTIYQPLRQLIMLIVWPQSLGSLRKKRRRVASERCGKKEETAM